VDLAEYGRMWQIAVDCRQIAVDCRQIAVRLPSRSRSLITESVETGGRMQGVMGVSRDILLIDRTNPIFNNWKL
jgi:hypothetical protein